MPCILIIDDDDNQRLLYREAFEAEGYDVVEARDGREGLVVSPIVAPTPSCWTSTCPVSTAWTR